MQVTEDAMRPASDKRQCFYCQQPIGSAHKPDCVLVKKRARIRMIVEYEVDVPASWTKDNIEFQRNESSWCSSNALEELEELHSKESCLCRCTEFEYIEDASEPFLKEI